MSNFTTIKPLNGYKQIEVRKVRPGDLIINLGPVLEIEELSDHFSIIIYRRNKKEVYQFDKGYIFLIENASS